MGEGREASSPLQAQNFDNADVKCEAKKSAHDPRTDSSQKQNTLEEA